MPGSPLLRKPHYAPLRAISVHGVPEPPFWTAVPWSAWQPRTRPNGTLCAAAGRVTQATPVVRLRAFDGVQAPGTAGVHTPAATAVSEFLACHLATAMTSLSTPLPTSCGPAPGPMIVTCPVGSGPAHHCVGDAVDTGQRISGVNRFGLHPGGHGPRPVGPENVSDATCRSRPPASTARGTGGRRRRVVVAPFEEEGGTGQLPSSNRCLPAPTTTGWDQQLELVERPCWGRKATRVPLARRRCPCRAG